VTLVVSLLPANLFAAGTNLAAANSAPAATNAPADSTLADLNALVTKINDKLTHDKNQESDLADNLKEFDVLLARHQDAAPEERAHILVMKAQLYMQVLNQPEKALPIFKQIKTDFPTTTVGQHADEIISELEPAIEKKKIRDALAPGAPFPDFHETDVKGQPLSISQFKGKVILVDFWATWCVPCVVKLPEIQKAYGKFHDKGFEVVGVSLDEDKDHLEEFTRQKNMPWPEFFDGKRWENKLAVKYGVDATPTGYLLDRNGKIIKILTGADDLDADIAQALKK
jgi:peroxiredoxin